MTKKDDNATSKEKKFKPKKATCIAADDTFVGGEYIPGDRNTYLFRTKKGNYFVYFATIIPGEQGRIDPLDRTDALTYFASLPTKRMTEEEAFPPE